jgi:hypothetical protein
VLNFFNFYLLFLFVCFSFLHFIYLLWEQSPLFNNYNLSIDLFSFLHSFIFVFFSSNLFFRNLFLSDLFIVIFFVFQEIYPTLFSISSCFNYYVFWSINFNFHIFFFTSHCFRLYIFLFFFLCFSSLNPSKAPNTKISFEAHVIWMYVIVIFAMISAVGGVLFGVLCCRKKSKTRNLQNVSGSLLVLKIFLSRSNSR